MGTLPSRSIVAFVLSAGIVGCGEEAESPTEATPLAPHTTVPASAVVEYWQVSAGGAHTCGVTTDRRTYCWGNNGAGQLGDGTFGFSRLVPTLIAGGLQFRHVSTGASHTCGVARNSRLYCWGGNAYGELGDGTAPYNQLEPVAVAGGL
jgi:hypothetical protein